MVWSRLVDQRVFRQLDLAAGLLESIKLSLHVLGGCEPALLCDRSQMLPPCLFTRTECAMTPLKRA